VSRIRNTIELVKDLISAVPQSISVPYITVRIILRSINEKMHKSRQMYWSLLMLNDIIKIHLIKIQLIAWQVVLSHFKWDILDIFKSIYNSLVRSNENPSNCTMLSLSSYLLHSSQQEQIHLLYKSTPRFLDILEDHATFYKTSRGLDVIQKNRSKPLAARAIIQIK